MKVRIRTLVTSALVALALCLFSLVQSTSAVNDCKKVEGRYKSLFRWRKRCGSPNHKFVNASVPSSLQYANRFRAEGLSGEYMPVFEIPQHESVREKIVEVADANSKGGEMRLLPATA